jgi:6-phosphofructokinase 1
VPDPAKRKQKEMKRISVMTSGGDAPGMNAAIRAVVRTAVAKEVEIYGVERGFQGLIEGMLRPLNARSVSGIIHHGGTILRTARSAAFREEEGLSRAVRSLEKNGIEGLVVIGGDGSYRGAHALWKHCGIPCVGIPGTIDNDIGGTQYTIGFDTALNVAMEAIDRLRDTAASHDRTFFVEVMGRHNGFIGMCSGLAGGAEEVLVPEQPFDLPMLVETLRAGVARGKTSMIVIVAEGGDGGGAYEVSQKVAEASEFKDSRIAVIGHMQRGGTPSAFDRILASRMGVSAVENLLAGASGMMIAAVNNAMVPRPFEDAWNTRNLFDPEMLQVLHTLGV